MHLFIDQLRFNQLLMDFIQVNRYTFFLLRNLCVDGVSAADALQCYDSWGNFLALSAWRIRRTGSAGREPFQFLALERVLVQRVFQLISI